MTNESYVWNRIPVRVLSSEPASVEVSRAGVIPFIRTAEGVEFLFMTPRHRAGLSAPKDQIAKGGRWVKTDAGWQEIEDRNAASLAGLTLEPCIDTAIREGAEELGLRTDNIAAIYELGSVQFLSEKKKTAAWMALFAAEVKSKSHFDDVTATVGKVRWLTLDAFMREGREDHRPILEAAWKRVQNEGF